MLLMVMSLAGVGLPHVAAQDTPTEVFYSEEMDISFLYPAGWIIDPGPSIILQSPDNEIALVFIGPSIVDEASRGAVDGDKALERTLLTLGFTLEGTYTFRDVAGRPAIFVDARLDSLRGYAAVIAFDGGGWGMVIVTGDARTLGRSGTLIEAIIASYNAGPMTGDAPQTPRQTNPGTSEQIANPLDGVIGQARVQGEGALGSSAPGESFDAPQQQPRPNTETGGVTCIVTATRVAIRRSQPNPTADNLGTLSRDESAPAFARAEDGRLTWYQLEDGSWVRSDVVVESEGCSALPLTNN